MEAREGDLAEYQQLFLLYEQTHEVDYLEAAIAVAESEGHPDNSSTGRDLRRMLSLKTQLSQPAAEPNTLQLCGPPHNTDDAAGKSDQAFSRYQRTGNLKDLDEAIELAKISACTPPEHPARALRMCRVCSMLAERFERRRTGGDYAMILQIIAAVQELTEAASEDVIRAVSPIVAEIISKIDGWVFNGIIQSTEDQVNASRVLINPRSDDGQVGGMQHWITKRPNMPSLRFDSADIEDPKAYEAGVMFHIVFPREPGDIDEAATHESEMLATTLEEDPRRMHWYCVLGQEFLRRYINRGVKEDLELAVRFGEQAVVAIPPKNIGRTQTLLCWANICTVMHGITGDANQLDTVIQILEEVMASPEGPGALPKWHCLTMLASVYRRIYRKTDDLDDLDQALEYMEEAVTLAGNTNPVELDTERKTLLETIYLSALASTSDLDKAIKLHDDALRMARARVPSDDTYELGMPGLELTDLLFRRFDKLRNKDDLSRGIKVGENILRVARYLKSDSATTGRRLLEPEMMREVARLVGVMLVDQFKISNGEDPAVAANLDRAAKLLNKALEGAYGMPAALLQWRISQMHLARFQHSKSPEELEKAHLWSLKALETAPHDDEMRYILSEHLAIILDTQMRHEAHHACDRTATLTKLPQLLALLLQEWEAEELKPNARINGARSAADILFHVGMVEEAFSLLEKAVAELPRVCQRSGRRDDQQYGLSQREIYGLASMAATAALRTGRSAYQALKLLEFGRGLISGFSIDCRSDLTDLRASYPEYAGMVESLRAEMDSPLVGGRMQRGKKRAAAEFEKTLDRIRELPGQEGFLLPPPPEALTKMAADGPIVVINCNTFGSHALIVTSLSIQSLPLPDLLPNDVEQHMDAMSASLKGTVKNYNKRNRSMGKHLLWLWDVAVSPILKHLKLRQSNLTRIWWIGVGKLSMAPFHAAGDHSPGSTRNTISRAISCYIPSIKAMSYTRQKQLSLFPAPEHISSFASGANEHPDSNRPRLLMVTMPTTVGKSALAGAKQEVKDIAGALSSESVSLKELEWPSAAQVLDQLPTHHIVHFACHGISDLTNPSDSRLLLQNPDPGSTEPDKLSVRAVSSANTDAAQIAYLSACSTAENRSVMLADEAIHIASSFQLAGFSHVLATLWESDDRLCQRVATEFYSRLFRGVDGVEANLRVAMAYHEAVKMVRDKKPKDFLGWAPFIHTGA